MSNVILKDCHFSNSTPIDNKDYVTDSVKNIK